MKRVNATTLKLNKINKQSVCTIVLTAHHTVKGAHPVCKIIMALIKS